MAGLAHSTISAMRSPRPRLPLLWLLCSALLIQSASARRSHHAHKHGHGRKGAVEEFSAANADPHIYRGATAKPLPNPLPVQDMPGAFTWCDTPSGRSFCGPSWNQHIPAYCGSCYVHGALHAANDRIKLLLDGHHDLMLARQTIINCAPVYGLGAGCDGGEVYDVFEYMHRYGLPDESCQNYLARPTRPGAYDHHKHHDRHHEASCDPIDVCMNCMPSIKNDSQLECWDVDPPILFFVREYGALSGEEAIMNEIYRRGPVTCAFASVDDFDYNYRGGIYVDHTNATESNHDVEVVGWGFDPELQMKYWIARNSWGTYWGQNSFFRIVRGINNMRFEEECIFATFDVSELLQVLRGKSRGGMFGIVDEEPPRTTEVRWNDTKTAAGHKKTEKDEDDEEHEVRRARKHHGRGQKKTSV